MSNARGARGYLFFFYLGVRQTHSTCIHLLTHQTRRWFFYSLFILLYFLISFISSLHRICLADSGRGGFNLAALGSSIRRRSGKKHVHIDQQWSNTKMMKQKKGNGVSCAISRQVSPITSLVCRVRSMQYHSTTPSAPIINCQDFA